MPPGWSASWPAPTSRTTRACSTSSTQLGDSGILDELVAQGVEEEDTIKIGEYEFDYLY